MSRALFLAAIALVTGLVGVCLPTEAARILGFFPSPSKSHALIHCAIADTLARAGHNVTVVGTIPNVYKNAPYKYVRIEGPAFDVSFMNEMINKPQPVYRNFGGFLTQIFQIGNATLAHDKMQQFMREHRKSFDLMILGYFINDFHLGLAAHFNVPVIVSNMIQPILTVNDMLGNPPETAYVPTLLFGQQQPMSFSARVKNFVGSLLEGIMVNTFYRSMAQHYYKYHFPSDRYPSLDEVDKRISLVFTNHHFTQGPIRPNVPALIEIGGIQIKEQPDPLPTDIAQVLDNAPEGVIYFSLGSNVQGASLSTDKAKIMFAVLSQLPYKVLWKWGDSEFPGTSSNIVYKSWLPQDDILAHPNVKLFITHGGQGSVVESQYHGVPMVGIPLFGDQPANMANVERVGFGLSLNYLSLTVEKFRTAILEVLQNPIYSNAVKKFSTLYRDRPMTPRQLVVYWTEYVLRHKGALHLQSPAVHLNKWQLMSLDVIGFLLLIVVIVFSILIKLSKMICCRGKRATHERRQSKSKKNK